MPVKRILVTLLLAGGAVVASGHAAEATPTGCSTSQTFQTASATCTSGTGQYRVAVFAIHQIWGATQGQTFYGPWVSIGQVSSVTPPAVYVIPTWSQARVETQG